MCCCYLRYHTHTQFVFISAVCFVYLSVTLYLLCVCVCQVEELWSVCKDSGEVCIWHMKDTSKPFHRVALQDCTGCYCMIKVKNQVNKQYYTHTHINHLHMHYKPGSDLPLLSRCGLAVLAAVLPKGRFTLWTWNATRY